MNIQTIKRVNVFIDKLNKRYDLNLQRYNNIYNSEIIKLPSKLQIVKYVKIGIINKKPVVIKEKEETEPDRYIIPDNIKLDEGITSRFKQYKLGDIEVDIDQFHYRTSGEMIEDINRNILRQLSTVKDDSGDELCFRKTKNEFEILEHQQIVKKYLNIKTPYRGLILYHGLGSGKTCSSIAILEGMRDQRNIYIMTPASLRDNYINQLSFCGDKIFRYNNHWTLYKLSGKKDRDNEVLKTVIKYLGISSKQKIAEFEFYIRDVGHIWMVDKNLPNNWDTLKYSNKVSIKEQINFMIRLKYTFISYNGMNLNKYKKMIDTNGGNNPFNNSVIVIDEAHNYSSRVINNIQKEDKNESVSVKMYRDIVNAENCKVVALTGTPYINHPGELSILTNMVSGAIVVFSFILKDNIQMSEINKIFTDVGEVDIVEYNNKSKELTLTRNPYHFKKYGNKIKYSKGFNTLNNDEYIQFISELLGKHNVKTVGKKTINRYMPFPENLKEFSDKFIDKGLIKDKGSFQYRLVGKVSHLGDKENLMPVIIPSEDGYHIHEVECDMSTYQTSVYTQLQSGASDSQYLIFSRASCNFVFLSEDERPKPTAISTSKRGQDEKDILKEEKDFDFNVDGDEFDVASKVSDEYVRNVNAFLNKFNNKEHQNKYFNNDLRKFVNIKHDVADNTKYGLKIFSNKYYNILQNIIKHNDSCQLFYSNFRTIEGVGMMRLLLKYQGYIELSVERSKSGFVVKLHKNYPDQYYTDLNKMKVFSLYTGTEDRECKEIVRKIYNSQFNDIPPEVEAQLKKLYNVDVLDNRSGKLINVIMITASGAEGIDLKNTRIVHIAEPYWHHVRIEQVIGRARRICSHASLDPKKRNVKVYLYISKYNVKNKETVDQKLNKKMKSKKLLSDSFLNALKEVAIDCKARCFKLPKSSENLKPRIEKTLNIIPKVRYTS